MKGIILLPNYNTEKAIGGTPAKVIFFFIKKKKKNLKNKNHLNFVFYPTKKLLFFNFYPLYLKF
jgi:hypothetical protein